MLFDARLDRFAGGPGLDIQEIRRGRIGNGQIEIGFAGHLGQGEGDGQRQVLAGLVEKAIGSPHLPGREEDVLRLQFELVRRLDDQPAVITRAYGKGRITYIGAVLDDKLMAAATEWMTNTSGVTPVLGPVPDGIEVSRRIGPGKQVFVLINYSQDDRRVTLPHSMNLVLDGKNSNTLDLAPYGVAVALDNR